MALHLLDFHQIIEDIPYILEEMKTETLELSERWKDHLGLQLTGWVHQSRLHLLTPHCLRVTLCNMVREKGVWKEVKINK